MDGLQRAVLARLPDAGRASDVGQWDGLWQNAVGSAMGREQTVVTHVDDGAPGEGLLATIWAELTR